MAEQSALTHDPSATEDASTGGERLARTSSCSPLGASSGPSGPATKSPRAEQQHARGEQRGTDASARLVEEHLPLVEHIVLRLSATFPRFVDRSDLVSAGTLGLVEAAHRFDPEVGVPFGRYAARRIRGAILDLLRSTDWAPRSVRAMTREVERAEQVLTVKHGRRPDDAELAAEIGVEPGELAELRGRVQRGVVMAIDQSGDDMRRSSPSQRLYDRCASTPDESVEFAEVRGYVRDALDNLPDRHRMVAIGYYLEGRTFEELAELLSITPSRVSQLRAEAVIMMRDGIGSQYEQPPSSPARPVGRVARRQARYAAAIARNSSWRQRLLANDEPMTAHLSSGLATPAPWSDAARSAAADEPAHWAQATGT